MLNHIIFFSYLYIILISILGYGITVSKFLFSDYKKLSLSIFGFSGFSFLVAVSFLTSLIYRHDYIHNILLHLLGIFLFFSSKLWSWRKKDFKNLLLLSSVYLIGLFIYKTHDDFPYYHLTYTRFLFDHEIFIGMGWLGHGFRTFSSLFFFNSINIFPKLEFYGFHFSIYFLVLFTSTFYIDRINFYLKNKLSNFLLFYSVLAFIYCNNIFHRFAEYGVDRSAQSLLLLIIFLFFETNFLQDKKKFKFFNNQFNNNLSLILLLCSFAATLKALFIIYFLFLINFIKDLFNFKFIKNNLRILSLSFFLIFSTLTINFFNTGCFLYPAKNTCLEKIYWSIPKKEVEEMKIHYEWWAKAGGGPDYSSPIKKSDYVKNFVWFKDWIKFHFFNKVSDNIVSVVFISFLFLFVIQRSKINKKIIYSFNFKFFFTIYFLVFAEWFLNHPSMRYGGYVLVALPIVILTSIFASRYNYNYAILKKKITYLMIISLITFNIQNVIRIIKEDRKYNFNYISSPFYYLPKPKYKTFYINDEVKSYKPIDNMCWAVPTPCAAGEYIIKNAFGKKIIIPKELKK